MLEGVRHIHMIGIAGAGMRAIADILIDKGFRVSGSDISESGLTERFRTRGAVVHIGHDASYVAGADVVIRSTAIHEDNPELEAAVAAGIPILHRSDIVRDIIDSAEGIAVAGAHGKTTVTSMIGQVFMEGEADPTIIIGGEVDYLDGNSRLGKGGYAVAEADESDGSFLSLSPTIAVVTNVEEDHMDYYGTKERLHDAFVEFVNHVKENGRAVLCGDSDELRALLPRMRGTIITYGAGADNTYRYTNVRTEGIEQVFEIFRGEDLLCEIRLRVPGLHNVSNATATFVTAYEAGISVEAIRSALLKFTGAKRRFETKGIFDDIWVVDDYAHHPTEVRATLEAAKAMGTHRIVCVFQPHRYTRTAHLLEEFARAFEAADEVYFTEIYTAGEEPIPGIDGHSIPNEMKRLTGKEAGYIERLDDVPAVLSERLRSGDLLITMGAGVLNRYGPLILERLKENAR